MARRAFFTSFTYSKEGVAAVAAAAAATCECLVCKKHRKDTMARQALFTSLA
jgi:hypothetical protein